MALGFYFDNARCTGCRTCVMACKDYHDLDATISYRKVYDYEGGTWNVADDGTCTQDAFVYHISIACNHCNDPACMRVCPTGAMHKDDLGIVLVDQHVCIGCGYCTLACPYHAPAISPVTNTSSKCDACRDRLSEGKKPICVEACPLRALDFGDIDELRAAHGDLAGIPPLPDPSATDPNLVIEPSPAALAAAEGRIEGHVANRDECQYPRYEDVR